MDDSKYVEALKKIKQVKDENKKRVEKIRNVNLEEKKRIITCSVNVNIIVKLINDGVLFDPRGDGGKLVWIDKNNNLLNLTDAVELLKSKLNSD